LGYALGMGSGNKIEGPGSQKQNGKWGGDDRDKIGGGGRLWSAGRGKKERKGEWDDEGGGRGKGGESKDVKVRRKVGGGVSID